jgi:hypothetical protein
MLIKFAKTLTLTTLLIASLHGEHVELAEEHHKGSRKVHAEVTK